MRSSEHKIPGIKDPVTIDENDLQNLLDENKRLREENERLKNGLRKVRKELFWENADTPCWRVSDMIGKLLKDEHDPSGV